LNFAWISVQDSGTKEQDEPRSLASACFLAGFLRIWNGEPDAAIEHFAHAMRLSLDRRHRRGPE
jgi:hypothetical protein